MCKFWTRGRFPLERVDFTEIPLSTKELWLNTKQNERTLKNLNIRNVSLLVIFSNYSVTHYVNSLSRQILALEEETQRRIQFQLVCNAVVKFNHAFCKMRSLHTKHAGAAVDVQIQVEDFCLNVLTMLFNHSIL